MEDINKHTVAPVTPIPLEDLIARAKAKIAEQKAKAAKKAEIPHLNYVDSTSTGASTNTEITELSATQTTVDNQLPVNGHPIAKLGDWEWNAQQQKAIDMGLAKKSFCLIGAAGTGKTTNLRGILTQLLQSNLCPPLEIGTKWLSHNSPGIVLVSFTRRAVRNIAKQMPPELKDHCMTIHKLIEFGPEFYDEWDANKNMMVRKMRFAPYRHSGNPLPKNLLHIVIDESSMVDTKLMEKLLDALPYPARVQFIFLGDLNQLPPVYGQAILGESLLQLPIIELTQVYRQALESPIIALALAVKDNSFKSFNEDAVNLWGAQVGFDVRKLDKKAGPVVLERKGRGKVTLQPWKVVWDQEDSLRAILGQINRWILDGVYLPDEDLILCPWNKAFGTVEINKGIADRLGKMRGAVVHEVIAGYNKYYLAVGDKIIVDKNDAIILDIKTNPKYLGQRPHPASKDLDRYGVYAPGADATFEPEILTDEDIDLKLQQLASQEVVDRTTESSHKILVRYVDMEDEEDWIDKSAVLNNTTFGYATTVHKAQGSECRRVFFITHYCHSAMLYRELVYTAITRAAEELHIIMSPEMLATAAKNARIKGNTLEEKLKFYTKKQQEKLA